MARIKRTDKYPIKQSPVGDDYLIGTDSQNNNKTASFRLSTLSDDVFNQNNVVIEISYGDRGTVEEVIAKINDLPLFTVLETEIVLFTGTVAQDRTIYLLKTGRGEYGFGGTQLTIQDIYPIEVSNQDNKFVEINYGNTEGGIQAVLTAINSLPQFTIGEKEIIIYVGINDGAGKRYLSKLGKGTYGAGSVNTLNENNLILLNNVVEEDNVPYVSEVLKKESTISSNLFGGTGTQPNLVGLQIHAQYSVSDGVTSTYDVTAPFTINNLPRVNIRVNVKRFSDGALITATEGSGLSVNSGYGTNTINVTLTTVPSNGDLIEFTVYGENEDPAANATLITTTGYDNSTNAIASLNTSHHGIVFTGNGHNTLLGGSFLRAWGSFNTAAGSGVWIGRNDDSSIGCFAFGRGLEVDGLGSTTIGVNNKVSGTSSFWFGRDSNIDDLNDTVGIGRKGEAIFSSSFVQSGGRSTDISNGQHQYHVLVLNGETPDANEVFMRDATGATSFEIPNNSAYSASVSVIALKDDATKTQSFFGKYNIIRDNSGTVRINGSTGDVNILTEGSYGSPSYNADIRGIAGKIGIRVTGEASENVRWSATLQLTQVKY